MPARLWRHGIHSFMALLGHPLPQPLEHLLRFVCTIHQIVHPLMETIPVLHETLLGQPCSLSHGDFLPLILTVSMMRDRNRQNTCKREQQGNKRPLSFPTVKLWDWRKDYRKCPQGCLDHLNCRLCWIWLPLGKVFAVAKSLFGECFEGVSTYLRVDSVYNSAESHLESRWAYESRVWQWKDS